MKKRDLFYIVVFIINFTFIVAMDSAVALTTYSYDKAGRLIAADFGKQRIAYKYDPSGNLISRELINRGAGEESSIAPKPDIKVNQSDGPVVIDSLYETPHKAL